MQEQIKILVVDDSITAREIIIGILESDPEVKVIGEARNGKEAIELTNRLKPDLITMDIKMPVMNGLEAIKYIMAYSPTPIIVVAQSAFDQGDKFIFDALELGALEVLEKPSPNEWKTFPKIGVKLIKEIKSMAKIPVITHIRGRKKIPESERKVPAGKEHLSKVVAIASSTGGPKALLKVLSKFPQDFPAGVLIVQHITEGFVKGLTGWLNTKCEIDVKIACDGEKVNRGVAYVAPCDSHMVIKKDGRIGLNNEPPVSSLRPAADILFYSVAEYYGKNAVGVILTGMGRDGAKGLKVIKGSGGKTIAQDKKSCLINGMPKAAIKIGAVDKIVPLDLIAEEIINEIRD